MLGVRPLPPVRVPVTVVDGAGAGSSERSVTGTEVTSYGEKAGWRAELRRIIDSAWSPGWAGVETVSVKVREASGASVTEIADSLPKRRQVAVLA